MQGAEGRHFTELPRHPEKNTPTLKIIKKTYPAITGYDFIQISSLKQKITCEILENLNWI